MSIAEQLASSIAALPLKDRRIVARLVEGASTVDDVRETAEEIRSFLRESTTTTGEVRERMERRAAQLNVIADLCGGES